MLQPIEKDRLDQRVLQSLQEFIIAKGLGPGDNLPSEREMAEKLNVSRNTVREALKSLGAVGIIARSQKTGNVLQPIDLRLLANISRFAFMRSAEDLRDLLVARRIIELNILPLSVRNVSEEDIHRMEVANKLMEAAIDSGAIGTEHDFAFHRALLEASRNNFLIQCGSLIQEFFREPGHKVLIDEVEARDGLSVHRKLIECLREGDVGYAQELMEEHLNAYYRRGVVAPDDTREWTHSTNSYGHFHKDQSRNTNQCIYETATEGESQ